MTFGFPQIPGILVFEYSMACSIVQSYQAFAVRLSFTGVQWTGASPAPTPDYWEGTVFNLFACPLKMR